MTSDNGIDWAASRRAPFGYWFDVKFGDGFFFTVSDASADDLLMYSRDGLDWSTLRASQQNEALYSCAYGDEVWVFVGAANNEFSAILTVTPFNHNTATEFATPIQSRQDTRNPDSKLYIKAT
jgi:hypothetical protein